MNSLSRVFILKIAATVVFWCIPLLLFPASVLEIAGLPQQESYIFIRMLGWAYLSLCVGYYFGLRASLAEKRSMGIIWVGIVSNSGPARICFTTASWVPGQPGVALFNSSNGVQPSQPH